MGLGNLIGGIASNVIKDPFGVSGVGNVGVSFGQNGPSISANFNRLLQDKVNNAQVDNGPLKKLYSENPTQRRKAPTYIFPLDLDSEHFMIYNVVKRKRAGVDDKVETQTKFSIVLPIPTNVQAQYNVGYQNVNMGVAGSMMAGMTSGEQRNAAAMDIASSIGGGAGNLIAEMFGGKPTDSETSGKPGTVSQGAADSQLANSQLDALGMIGISSGIGALAGGPLGAIAGTVVGGADSAFKGALSAAGVAYNPHMAVMFEGVGFREFNFAYRFIAKNEQESEQLRVILHQLRYFMYPSLRENNKFFFEYPEEFEIEFSNAVSPYLFKINRCVLKSLNINYNGENMPVWFEQTNAPVVIDIQMAFQETRILTKEVLDDEFKSGGYS